MSSRRTGPVLLELVRDSPRPQSSASSSAPTQDEPAPGSGMLNWAGRTVRVPAGYLFVVIAVIVAVGLLGYTIGYGRASQIAEQQRARELGAVINDPLDSGPPDLNLAPRPEEPAVESTLAISETSEQPNDAATGAQTPAEQQPSGDARTEGLNYYVLVRDLPAEGDRLVAWLDSRGVPAMTEPVSGGLVKVIVLDGFERGQASSARALSFKQHLRELGARWKRDHKGSSDFSDLYLEKFRG